MVLKRKEKRRKCTQRKAGPWRDWAIIHQIKPREKPKIIVWNTAKQYASVFIAPTLEDYLVLWKKCKEEEMLVEPSQQRWYILYNDTPPPPPPRSLAWEGSFFASLRLIPERGRERGSELVAIMLVYGFLPARQIGSNDLPIGRAPRPLCTIFCVYPYAAMYRVVLVQSCSRGGVMQQIIRA